MRWHIGDYGEADSHAVYSRCLSGYVKYKQRPTRRDRDL